MLFTCNFFFYGSLNDFLPQKRKEQWIPYSPKTPASAKDAIEAIGIPHVEVRKIVVNGEEKSIYHLLQPNNSIVVFPFENQFPLSAPRAFVLDVHLGKLARLLRMLGIDAFYQNTLSDQEIAALAAEQKRTVLTRDIGLLKQKVLQYGYWLRSQQPEEQLLETMQWFSLCSLSRPFSRCMACNGLLQPVAKDRIEDHLPPQTKEYFNEFYQCTGCGHVYWKGSHYENMQRLVERVRSLACQ
jgi:uncharacterized protein with PIN domain